MFRKPKRSNIRQRRQDRDSDEEQETQKNDDRPVIDDDVKVLEEKSVLVSAPPAVVPTLAPPAAKLSFAEDHEDEGAEFKVRKSSHSRRVAKQLEKERRKRVEEMSQKEREAKKLTEEKQAFNSSISIRKQMEKKELDVVFVNQHVLKREEEQKPVDEVIQIPDEDGMSDDDENEAPVAPIVTFRPAAARSAIPDAETIFSLKKQRQSRRNQEDFIALTQETMPADGPEAEKVDEDDEEFEDDRIDFEVDKTKSDRMKAREAISSAQDESMNKSTKGRNTRDTRSSSSSSSGSSDNELSKWEEEQIMKGVGLTNSKKVREKMDQHNSELMDVSSPQGVNPVSLFEKKSTGSSIPSHLTRSRTHVRIDDVLSRLHDAVTEKQDKLNYLDRQLGDMQLEEKSLNETLERLEAQQKEFEGRRTELVQRLQQELTDKDSSDHQVQQFTS